MTKPMARKRKIPDHRETIDAILIDELDIECDDILVPSARLIEDLNGDADAPVYIAVRLENELEIELPDGAEEKFITVKDVYDCISRIAR
jgi:acyl carrier protein